MAVKYVKDFMFSADRGFHGSNKMPKAAMASERDMPARARANAPARGAPRMSSPPKVGKGQGYARGGYLSEPRQPEPIDYSGMRAPARRAAMENRAMMRGRRFEKGGYVPGMEKDVQPVKKPPGRGMDLAPSKPFKGEYQGYAKGGDVKSKKIGKVMREYKEGKLHSGSKKGPVVKNPKQAMAIALSEARAAKKAKGGPIFSDEYMAYESKGPKTRYTPAKGRREAKERRMEKWAEQRMKHAEKYAPGLSVDMEDESMVREGKMLKYAKGGKAKHSDVKMDKAVVRNAVHKHERKMHPGKKLTKLKHGGVPPHGRKPMYGGGKC
jgi:hypothetical protein